MDNSQYQEIIVEPAQRLAEELNIQDGLCPICGKGVWRGHKLSQKSVEMCRKYHDGEA